jgi:hypothetical protein
MLPRDVVLYVQKNFSISDQEEALDFLKNAKLHNGSYPDERMLRCALFASKNNLKGLSYQIDGLANDYRDVILSAEYARKEGDYVQVRDLSKPFDIN